MKSGITVLKSLSIFLRVLFFVPASSILIKSWLSNAPVSGTDFFLQFLPWWEQMKGVVLSGRLPWWDGSSMMGVPVLADPQSALLYIPNWLFFVLSVETALTLLVVIHLLFGGLLMVNWVKRRTGHVEVAWISGLIVELTAYYWMHIQSGHYTMICAAAWLPAILSQAERYREKPANRALVYVVILLAFQYFAGHPQTSFLSGLGAVVLLYPSGNGLRIEMRRFLMAFLVLFVIVMGPVALQVELVGESARGAVVEKKFFDNNMLPPVNLVQYLSPYILGDGRATPYRGNGFFHETFNYLGILPLFLAAVAPVKRNGRILILGATGLFLAMMPGIPGVSDLVRVLPVAGGFRAWARSVLLFNTAVAVLAGDGLKAILEGIIPRRKVFGNVAVWMVLMLAINGFSGIFHVSPEEAVLNGVRILVPISAWVLIRITENRRKTPLLLYGLATVVILDAGTVTMPRVRCDYPFSLKTFRLFSNDLDGVLKDDPARIVFLRESLLANMGFILKRDTIFGYRPLPLKRYQNYMNISTGLDLETPQVFVTFTRPGRLSALAGVRWWFGPSDAPERLKNKGNFKKWQIYEDTSAFPRSWLVHDFEIIRDEAEVRDKLTDPRWNPGKTVLLEEDSLASVDMENNAVVREDIIRYLRHAPGDIRIHVEASKPGWVVVTESWYPGWRAQVDHRKASVLRADYLFMAVPVKTGRHSVRLYYDPGWRRIAVFSPLVFLSCVLIFLSITRERRDAA